MQRTISIKTALTLMSGFSALAVLLIAGIGAFAFYQSAGRLAAEVNISQAIRQEMAVDMFHEGVEASVLRALLTGPEGSVHDIEAVRKMLDSAVEGITSSFADLEATPIPEMVKAQLATTKPLLDRYVETARKTVDIGLADRAGGQAQLSDFMASFSTLEVELERQAELLEAYGTKTEVGNDDANRFYALVLALSTLVTVLFMAASSWRFTRHVVKPILRLRAALDEVANGDFGLRLGKITRNDDIGAIARDIDRVSDRVVLMMAEQQSRQDETDLVISRLGKEMRGLAAGNLTAQITEPFSGTYDQLRQDFNQAARQLRRSISQVVEVSDSIRAQSADLSRASENLASRTENQAATLEETAAALEQVTNGMTSAAESAREVEAVVQRARNEVDHSGQIVLGAVTAMHEIEASSAQISQIIGVIDDIAFQTNLLALNAGVEAARAGDAGRGFAVVASEVRALAQRSSLAAKEIKGLISASAGQVERGVQQVDQARSALTAVVSEVTRISDLVSNIARGAGEQSRALHEINLGVAQLDQVTQQNAAMAEESGAASRAVEDEAIGLDKVVGQFDTGGKRRSAGRMAA